MDGLVNLISTAGSRFTNNLQASFTNMTLQQGIRLVVIVCGYLLLRPFLMKLGARAQMKAFEQEQEKSKAAAAGPLRDQVDIADDTDEEGGDGNGAQASATNWGKKARRRQRAVMKKMLDEHEQKLRESKEEEEDKDIEEFLIKD